MKLTQVIVFVFKDYLGIFIYVLDRQNIKQVGITSATIMKRKHLLRYLLIFCVNKITNLLCATPFIEQTHNLQILTSGIIEYNVRKVYAHAVSFMKTKSH